MDTSSPTIVYKREIIAGLIALLAAIILFFILFYLPRPSLVGAPSSVKDGAVSLMGHATPHTGIVLFDKNGQAIFGTSANDKGEFTLTNVPIGTGTNIFSLRALNAGWRFSFPLQVKIQRDNIAPLLRVDALQGTAVNGSGTVISGRAEPGSSVTVNGVKTTVNPDGSWQATVALEQGANTVTISATDPAGNTTTETQTIQYAPSAASSQTGLATTTASSTALSTGSLPASSAASSSQNAFASQPPTSTASAPSAAASSSPSAPVAQPTPQPVLAIIATAWVSNSSPNERANETIYASVKDNYGRPVTNASVIASVVYKTGVQNYSLTHQGNGTYVVSFKLNDKFVSDFRVSIDVTARSQGFSSTASTSFTPQ